MKRLFRSWTTKAAVPLAALALVACDESGTTSGEADALTNADTPSALETSSQTARTITIGEFRAVVDDELGTMEFEMLDPSEWTSLEGIEPSNLRTDQQALWCPQRVSNGRVDTIGLATAGGSVGFTPGDCGVSGFVYTQLGIFCGGVELTSFYGSELQSVAAEILFVSDPSYTAYTFASSGGDFGVDAATLPGPGAPGDAFGGPFGWGSVAAGATETSTWAFQYVPGPFAFAGQIHAVVSEVCGNGIDDNCDGEIDNGCGELIQGDACWIDAECDTGFCSGATNLAQGTCEIGGCTDAAATNYNAAATGDDGSCTYTQTFYVDVNCSGLDLSTDTLYASHIDSEGTETITELSDVANNGVYSGVGIFRAGEGSYVYFTGAPGQANPTANITEDLSARSCGVDVQGQFRRSLTVSGAGEIREPYGVCGNCYVIDAFEDNSVSSIGAVSRWAAWSTLIGRRSDFHANETSVYVAPFQLPGLAAGESVVNSSLRFGIFNAGGSNPGPNFPIDLYGMGTRATAIPAAGDFYEGALDGANTLLEEDFTPTGLQVPAHDPATTYHATFFGATLDNYIANNYTANEYLTFRLSPGQVVGGGDDFVQVLASGAGDSRERPRLAIATDFSGTPGCVDPNANNYDPTAGYDDGTCTFDAVFCVDMGCPDSVNDDAYAFTEVYLTGPSFSWCADCVPLTETTPGTWCTGTLSLPNAPLEYKYQLNQWTQEEDLIGDGACVGVTDGFSYANRLVSIDGTTTMFNDTYGSCGSCPVGTITEVNASNTDGRAHNATSSSPDSTGFYEQSSAVTSAGEYYGFRSSPLTPFLLPDVADPGAVVHNVDLNFEVQTVNGVTLPVDVYARLGADINDLGAGDFYAGPALPDNGLTPELDGWSFVDADIMGPGTGAGTYALSPAGQARLAALLQEAYDESGVSNGTTLLIRLSPSDTTTPGWNDAVIFTGDAGAAQQPTMIIDQTGLSYGTPVVPGCTDNTANNYNASATTADGSCIYDITFLVDTSCTDPAATTGDNFKVQGPYWGWDPNQVEGRMLETGVGTNVWAVTIALPEGPFEYKYFEMAGQAGVVNQENLIDDMVGGASCAPVTDFANFANRQITVAGVATINDIYGVCGGACPAPNNETDYEVYSAGDDTVHGRYGTSPATVGDGFPVWQGVVGEYFGSGAVFVMPFDLPSFGDDEYVKNVTLRFMVNQLIVNGGGPAIPFNADLYGLDFRGSDMALADDYYVGASDSNNTLLVDNMLEPTHALTPPNQTTTSASSIADYISAQIAAGGDDQSVALRLNPDDTPVGWYQYEILRSGAAGIVERPAIVVTTDLCAAGEFVDCSGACVTGDPSAARGDMTCDDGSGGINLNCARFNFDDLDCAGTCPAGTTLGCDGATCVADANFGNGVCDASLNCDDTAYDHFDCTSPNVGGCAAGEYLDPSDGVTCRPVSTYVNTFADGTCQAYEDSASFAFGGGDCCVGMNTVTDCAGNIVCDPATGYAASKVGDGFCDSVHTAGFGDMLCAGQSYEGGDCQGFCAAGEVPTCTAFDNIPHGNPACAAAETMTASLGNGSVQTEYDCAYYRYDGGDAASGGQADCTNPGDLLDCDDSCLTASAALAFLGDTFCDSAAPNFNCSEWAFDYNPIADTGNMGASDCTVNLLTNGGFEAGDTSNWGEFPGGSNIGVQEQGTEFFGAPGSSFSPNSGSWAGKIFDNAGIAEQNFFQTFDGANALTAGQSYMLSGYAYAASQEPLGDGTTLKAWFKFFQTGFANAIVIDVPILDHTSPQDTWIPFSVCGDLPAMDYPIQQAGVYMLGDAGGTAWIDDMVLTPVASCPSAVNVTLGNRTHSNMTTYDVLQASNADTANGATADNRTIYGYTPDTVGGAPGFAGASWPQFIVPDGASVSVDGAVNADIGVRYVGGTGNVLTVDGVPVYQFATDVDETEMEGAFLMNWHAFAENGSVLLETPVVFGCMDSDANNYDPAATDDTGITCNYLVTFEYDMNCRGTTTMAANEIVYVQSNFNDERIDAPGLGEWDTGVQLSDADGDGIWTGTTVLEPGNWGYVGSVAASGSNGWAGQQENMTGFPCNNAPAVDQRPIAVVDAPVTLSHAWRSCDAGCAAWSNTFCNVQFPSTVNDNAGNDVTVFSQLYVAGLTDNGDYDDPATWPSIIDVELLYGATGGDVAGFSTVAATSNVNAGNNHEYQATWTLPMAGTYDYAFRVSTDNGANWTYCFEDGIQASTGGDRGEATVN